MNINSKIPTSLRKLIKLYCLDARLSVTRRLTMLMSSLMTAVVVILLIMAIIICGTLALGFELRQYMSPAAAYGIIAGGYLLLIIIVLALKRTLIVNPLARLLSRALLDEPNEESR